MHWFLFVYTPTADKKGACSLLAQIPKATPPLLQPQLAGTRTDCLTRSFPQQQLAQSPLAHPTRQEIYSERSQIWNTSFRQRKKFVRTHTCACGLSWSLTKSSLAAPRSKRQHCCSTATTAAGARGGRSWMHTLSPRCPCRSSLLAGA